MLAALLATALTVPVPHPLAMVFAHVNDTRSHGVVGDGLLSLDEAIRLANGTLMPMQLSAAERARIQGMGSMVDGIRVDAMTTPVITLEAELTALTGMGMGMVVVEGMPDPMGMRPVLAGGTFPKVLALRGHDMEVMGFEFRGGQVGLDANMMMGTMAMAPMVRDCLFDGQTVACIKAHSMGSEMTHLMVEETSFRNAPRGILIEDNANGGMVEVDGEWNEWDGVQVAVDIVENGRSNMSMAMFWRCTMRNGAQFFRVRRGATSNSQLMLRMVHCDFVTSGDTVDVQGVNGGLTIVHHHHSRFTAGAGRKALWCHPRTGEFDVHGSEMEFRGDVSIAANLFTQRIWMQNNVHMGGTFTLDTGGSLPNLLWNRFEGTQVVVPPTATTQVRLRSCEFWNAAVNGQALAAPVTMEGCYSNGTSMAGQVTVQNAAAAPFLGRTTVTPSNPQVGSVLTLACDMPFGVGLVWDFAIAMPRPVTTREPVRIYGDVATAVVLPGYSVFQSTTNVPIPANPNLIGLEFHVQGVQVPIVAGSAAPAYYLPTGGLVRLR
ncbi:MAG: hypothetical protein RL148_1140 [Planctomycetota bacterium]